MTPGRREFFYHITVAAFIAAVMASGFVKVAITAEETTCKTRADLLEELKREHNETLQGGGISIGDNEGRLIEILVSPEGSWTIIVSDVDGFAYDLIEWGWNWYPKPPVQEQEQKLKTWM